MNFLPVDYHKFLPLSEDQPLIWDCRTPGPSQPLVLSAWWCSLVEKCSFFVLGFSAQALEVITFSLPLPLAFRGLSPSCLHLHSLPPASPCHRTRHNPALFSFHHCSQGLFSALWNRAGLMDGFMCSTSHLFTHLFQNFIYSYVRSVWQALDSQHIWHRCGLCPHADYI